VLHLVPVASFILVARLNLCRMPARSVVAALKMDLKALSRTAGEVLGIPRFDATQTNNPDRLNRIDCARAPRAGFFRVQIQRPISWRPGRSTAGSCLTLQGYQRRSPMRNWGLNADARLTDRAALPPTPARCAPTAVPAGVRRPNPPPAQRNGSLLADLASHSPEPRPEPPDPSPCPHPCR
jgi:hypothetical protein